MKDTIYLIVNKSGVQSMRKSFVGTKRDEVCVKLNVTVAEKAFQPPILEQNVAVEDWRDGVDIEDVKFERNVITSEEAEIVKERRLAKMTNILESQGYQVIKPEAEA